MRLPGASQWVSAMSARRRAPRVHAQMAAALARGQEFFAEGLLRFHEEEEEKRYPKVPVQVIALEPEQQGGTGPDI